MNYIELVFVKKIWIFELQYLHNQIVPKYGSKQKNECKDGLFSGIYLPLLGTSTIMVNKILIVQFRLSVTVTFFKISLFLCHLMANKPWRPAHLMLSDHRLPIIICNTRGLVNALPSQRQSWNISCVCNYIGNQTFQTGTQQRCFAAEIGKILLVLRVPIAVEVKPHLPKT